MDEFWKNLASLQERCKNLGYLVRTKPDAYDDIMWILWDMERNIGEMKYALHKPRGTGEGT